MSIDLDRITHPLRLASGSHQPGSGKGCAMNLISYINGDTRITDYPECSARPLAAIVQMVNDQLAGPDGFLSPENSVLVLDLGWRTVGTATGATDAAHALWIAAVLTNPEWGVLRFADEDGAKAIREIAELHRKSAVGEVEFAWKAYAAWSSAWSAARSAAESAAWSAAWSSARSAARSAAESAALSAAESSAWSAAESAARAAAWSSAESAARSAAWSSAESSAWSAAWSAARSAALIEFAGNAIDAWREIAGVDDLADIDAAAVNSALDRIHA